ncbi:MAG: MTH1187 family thiamine-binding protein [Paludibacteraceae bacterium]
MNKIINASLQVLPSGGTLHPYKIVDRAIEVIASSGLKYRVCPFETVVEGTYDEIMDVFKRAQQVCYDAGATSVMAYFKIQSNRDDVSIEDKVGKYDS